jgi:hypothetical protein
MPIPYFDSDKYGYIQTEVNGGMERSGTVQSLECVAVCLNHSFY